MLSISMHNTANNHYSLSPTPIFMSCWSLRLRLPPAKKAWKSFASKFHTKLLQNLQNSKTIKKRKAQRPHAKSTAISPSTFLEQHKRHHLLQLQTSKTKHALRFRYHGRYPFKKKAEPATVYIDRLFKQPIAAAELVTKYPPIAKDVKLTEQEEAGGTSNNDKEEEGCASTADDMWESLALASPQMNGIDQRAENFIQRFRAEMELQEMMARRL